MSLETFGLPSCLHISIAAMDIAVLEPSVGAVVDRRVSRLGRTDAVLIQSHPAPPETEGVSLWQHELASEWRSRLRPERQVWVHVDYHGYRSAWRAFGMPDPGSDFLDHIANRRAIRLRRYAHPYLRLCPVTRQVNTSGGAPHGGEGMECDYLSNLNDYSEEVREALWKVNEAPLVLADPINLTKMLNVLPGSKTLDGVRDTQVLFYPSS